MPAFSNVGISAGEGGGLTGGDARDGLVATNGFGGTQTAGGASNNGNTGAFLLGGNARENGSAGGGGYYGGGSGSFDGGEGGGGGGSAFVSPSLPFSQTVRGEVQTPPRQSDADYVAGVGVGGNTPGVNGGNGLVVIEAIFAGCDDDNDGVTNAFDLDADGDGIPDIIEAGGIDANNDGKADRVADEIAMV